MNISIEYCMVEAERMFASVNRMTSEHENYAFLVEEVYKELDKIEAMLRSKMMEITSDQKQAYTDRITTMRVSMGEHKVAARKAKERAENERREREYRRSRW